MNIIYNIKYFNMELFIFGIIYGIINIYNYNIVVRTFLSLAHI